jgi:hypothetical protein
MYTGSPGFCTLDTTSNIRRNSPWRNPGPDTVIPVFIVKEIAAGFLPGQRNRKLTSSPSSSDWKIQLSPLGTGQENCCCQISQHTTESRES